MSGTTHYYSFTINVPSSYNYLRIALSWIKKVTASSCSSPTPGIAGVPLADFALELYYGTIENGIKVASSDTALTNLELLQYTIPSGCSGTYTVRIVNKSYTQGLGDQTLGIAWY